MASSSSVAVPGMDTLLDLEPELWYACAGKLVHIPPLNSTVYYFVQGHVDHASATASTVDLEKIKTTPDRILCTVEALELMADRHTDEVYTRIKLRPLRWSNDAIDNNAVEENNKSADYVSKRLSSNDVKNAKFYIKEELLSMLLPGCDLSQSQDILCKDVHGFSWRFTCKHRRLTTGWAKFRTEKNLKDGDTVLFMRDTKEDLRVWIRRAKPSVTVSADSVGEAAKSAANGEPFEVCYYPRLLTPEFVVRADRVVAAIPTPLSQGQEFEMVVAHENNARGTIVSSVEAADPRHWPYSPWKRVQVKVDYLYWTAMESLEEEMRVNPWTVKLLQAKPHSG